MVSTRKRQVQPVQTKQQMQTAQKKKTASSDEEEPATLDSQVWESDTASMVEDMWETDISGEQMGTDIYQRIQTLVLVMYSKF